MPTTDCLTLVANKGNNLNKNKMNLKEKIKNYTTHIVDDRANNWEVIELSDLQDLLETDRAEQLKLNGVSKSFYCQQSYGVGGKMCDTQCNYCEPDK